MILLFFGHNALLTGMDCHHVFHSNRGCTLVSGRPFYSLSYRLSGQTTLEYNGKKLISTPGTLTYVPMNFSYATETSLGEMIVVHFNLTEEEAPSEPAVITPAKVSDYAQRFLALRQQFFHSNRRNPRNLSMFYGILADLEGEEMQHSLVMPRMLAAKEYLDTHLGCSDLGVTMVAQRLGISDSYLRRSFRISFGISPGAYIKKCRIENAKILLQTGYYTISQVATQCGFESLSYFSAEFHRLVGCSPSVYMNKK